jgi:AmmeMemoRadiSam system protein A
VTREPLSPHERRLLLTLAREAIMAAALGQTPPPVDAAGLPRVLRERAAAFVTLRREGELRGCIGGLEARWPLFEDVRVHAAQAAVRDYRFEPVRPEEVPELALEISLLTPPQPLAHASPEELPRRLRPGVDGVTLSLGQKRATFLPQVWERVPDPEEFLSLLCEKMDLPPDTWRHTPLEVQIYQAEKITE